MNLNYTQVKKISTTEVKKLITPSYGNIINAATSISENIFDETKWAEAKKTLIQEKNELAAKIPANLETLKASLTTLVKDTISDSINGGIDYVYDYIEKEIGMPGLGNLSDTVDTVVSNYSTIKDEVAKVSSLVRDGSLAEKLKDGSIGISDLMPTAQEMGALVQKAAGMSPEISGMINSIKTAIPDIKSMVSSVKAAYPELKKLYESSQDASSLNDIMALPGYASPELKALLETAKKMSPELKTAISAVTQAPPELKAILAFAPELESISNMFKGTSADFNVVAPTLLGRLGEYAPPEYKGIITGFRDLSSIDASNFDPKFALNAFKSIMGEDLLKIEGAYGDLKAELAIALDSVLAMSKELDSKVASLVKDIDKKVKEFENLDNDYLNALVDIKQIFTHLLEDIRLALKTIRGLSSKIIKEISLFRERINPILSQSSSAIDAPTNAGDVVSMWLDAQAVIESSIKDAVDAFLSLKDRVVSTVKEAAVMLLNDWQDSLSYPLIKMWFAKNVGIDIDTVGDLLVEALQIYDVFKACKKKNGIDASIDGSPIKKSSLPDKAWMIAEAKKIIKLSGGLSVHAKKLSEDIEKVSKAISINAKDAEKLLAQMLKAWADVKGQVVTNAFMAYQVKDLALDIYRQSIAFYKAVSVPIDSSTSDASAKDIIGSPLTGLEAILVDLESFMLIKDMIYSNTSKSLKVVNETVNDALSAANSFSSVALARLDSTSIDLSAMKSLAESAFGSSLGLEMPEFLTKFFKALDNTKYAINLLSALVKNYKTNIKTTNDMAISKLSKLAVNILKDKNFKSLSLDSIKMTLLKDNGLFSYVKKLFPDKAKGTEVELTKEETTELIGELEANGIYGYGLDPDKANLILDNSRETYETKVFPSLGIVMYNEGGKPELSSSVLASISSGDEAFKKPSGSEFGFFEEGIEEQTIALMKSIRESLKVRTDEIEGKQVSDFNSLDLCKIDNLVSHYRDLSDKEVEDAYSSIDETSEEKVSAIIEFGRASTKTSEVEFTPLFDESIPNVYSGQALFKVSQDGQTKFVNSIFQSGEWRSDQNGLVHAFGSPNNFIIDNPTINEDEKDLDYALEMAENVQKENELFVFITKYAIKSLYPTILSESKEVLASMPFVPTARKSFDSLIEHFKKTESNFHKAMLKSNEDITKDNASNVSDKLNETIVKASNTSVDEIEKIGMEQIETREKYILGKHSWNKKEDGIIDLYEKYKDYDEGNFKQTKYNDLLSDLRKGLVESYYISLYSELAEDKGNKYVDEFSALIEQIMDKRRKYESIAYKDVQSYFDKLVGLNGAFKELSKATGLEDKPLDEFIDALSQEKWLLVKYTEEEISEKASAWQQVYKYVIEHDNEAISNVNCESVESIKDLIHEESSLLSNMFNKAIESYNSLSSISSLITELSKEPEAQSCEWPLPSRVVLDNEPYDLYLFDNINKSVPAAAKGPLSGANVELDVPTEDDFNAYVIDTSTAVQDFSEIDNPADNVEAIDHTSSLDYWKQWCGLATVTQALMGYRAWATGLIIPTSSEVIYIQAPAILLPFKVTYMKDLSLTIVLGISIRLTNISPLVIYVNNSGMPANMIAKPLKWLNEQKSKLSKKISKAENRFTSKVQLAINTLERENSKLYKEAREAEIQADALLKLLPASWRHTMKILEGKLVNAAEDTSIYQAITEFDKNFDASVYSTQDKVIDGVQEFKQSAIDYFTGNDASLNMNEGIE